MTLLIILGSIIVITVYIVAATEFGHIAELKGYKKGKYIAWCIIAAFVGYCMVVALPDRRSVAAIEQRDDFSDELPDL